MANHELLSPEDYKQEADFSRHFAQSERQFAWAASGLSTALGSIGITALMHFNTSNVINGVLGVGVAIGLAAGAHTSFEDAQESESTALEYEAMARQASQEA